MTPVRSTRAAAALLAVSVTAACASVRDEEPAPPPAPTSAIAAGIAAVAPSLPDPDNALAVLEAFAKSCDVVTHRADESGLTEPADWTGPCAEAREIVARPSPSGLEATRFFATHFAWVRVGEGEAFATGYFEPEIEGCRTPYLGCDIPIYGVPDDLTRGTYSDESGEGRGRIDENGDFVLYDDRAAIEAGALEGRGLELAYAKDAADLFFLHIQGSGRVRMDDGRVLRIGYSSQNGREYIAIGRLLRERGIMAREEISMQSIKDWIRTNPEKGAELMRENKSYIFFRVLEGEGPLGAIEVPVTPRATVAADPRFVPLGAPVYLSVEGGEGDGLWVAQDTGGAIKGANRFDTFWGAGEEAARIAGGFAQNGSAFVLVPLSAYVRAQAKR